MTLSQLKESELLHSTIRQGPCQNINAAGVQAAALSPDVAQQYGVQPGQQFTVQTA